MAGRIRSIKPEILEDEKTASLSHLEWRLFVSLWLIADDHGNLRAEPDYIRGQTLWSSRESRESVAKAVDRLASVSLVSPYTVRGQSYLHISGWEKHQKVDHPGKPRMPTMADADSDTCVDSRESREGLANPPESLAPDLRPPTSDQDHEQDQGDASRLWEVQETLRREHIPGCRRLTLTADRKKRIRSLLSAGYSFDDLAECQRQYAREAKTNGGQWFNGDTNWRHDNVARTLGRIGTRGVVVPLDRKRALT